MHIKEEITTFRDKWYSYDKELIKYKKKYTSLDELAEKLDSSQFAIDLEGYHYECLFKYNPGDYLYVVYNGARFAELPEFPRWSYYNLFNGSMLCLEDPMYYKYPDMICGSFYGDKEKSGIIISLGIVKTICRKLGIKEDKVIFFSSSQGGYTGMYASAHMPNTLSIALNPRLYIQDTVHTKGFTEVSGIDLSVPDPLYRNDIIHCVKHGKSKHVMLFNIQCPHDWIHHGQRFCREFGITPCYGITTKDNCLFWIYDCAGAPDAHTSFETKSIFMFIDKVSKAFYDGTFTEEMRKNALIINECWHDIYELKKSNLELRQQSKIDFMYIRGGHIDSGRRIESLRDIDVFSKNSKFNFYRYDILTRNKKLTVCISGVYGSVDKYSVLFFDFRNNKILYQEECMTSKDVEITFSTGKNIEGLALLVYAGIIGKTQGQKLHVKSIEIWEEVS